MRRPWIWTAIAGICMLGCGDDGSSAEADGGSSTGDPMPTTTAADTSAGSSSTTDVTGSTGGPPPCDQPIEPGPVVDWPRYGLDSSNTRFNASETAITTDNVHCLEPTWSLDELAGVTSTPAVVEDVAYFGDWDGNVHAVGVVDGAEQWTTPVGAQVNDSPLVTRSTVFVGDADGFLHALDRATGATTWSVELDAHEDANLFSSPVMAGDTLVVGVASTELAKVKDDYTFRGSVVGLDPATGDERWRVYTTEDDATSGAGVSVWSSAAVDEARGLVYIGTGNHYEEPAGPRSDALLAIDFMTGELAWVRQFTEGDVYVIFSDLELGPDADVGAAPNLFSIGDRDVVGVGDKAGVYSVLDRDDGETIWAKQVGEGSHLGGVMTTAAVGDGAIYLTTNVWTDGFDFDDPKNTGTTLALRAEDGELLWEAPLAQPAFGAVTLAGGVVYHGTIDGVVHAFDAADGVELWSAEPGGDIGGGFSVVNGRLVVGHGYWFFTAPETPSGGLVVYEPVTTP